MLNPEDFQSTFHFLQKTSNESSEIKQLILYQLKWELKQKIGPKFFEILNKCSKVDNPTILEHFSKAVSYLHGEMHKFLTMAAEVGITDDVLLHLKAILFHSVDEQTSQIVRTVYKRTFLCFYQLQQRGADSGKKDQQEQCSACEKLKTKCNCWALVEKFRQCNQNLFELDLLDRLAGDIVVKIAHKTVEDQIRDVCGTVFDVSHLPTLKNWLENSIFSWLLEVYGLGDGGTVGEIRRKEFEYQRQRLLHYLHEIYAKYLVEYLFLIIIDYPDSAPVVKDLKVCLEWVKLRTYLTEDLRKSLEKRLLHPGVNTGDILTAYIQTVKTLKAVDPSGVLMDNVCQPVRQYLRSRSDTVRCIVSFLTESGSLDVNSDLLKNNQSRRSVDSDSDTEMDENWREWCPDPVDAVFGEETTKLIDGQVIHTTKINYSKRSRKSADIIGMLVEVYGSRELFVKEYSQLLAERLLRQMSYDIENELQYLELLKLRFGESELHLCEVMLKDVKDSQRIDAFVTSQESSQQKLVSQTVPMSALILSAQFWPQLKDDRLEWPEQIKTSFESYRKSYESFKGSRTLDVKPNLGLVELELEFNGKTVEFCVTPLLASVIWLFQEKSKWSVEELAQTLKVSTSVLKRRVSWWSTCGVLKFLDGFWQLNEDLPVKHRRFSLGADDDEDTDALSADESDKEQQLEVYWTYITGLLKNLESLTAERIHNLLKMFGGQTHEGISLEIVHNFLQRKVREQLLIYTGGVYKLPKK